jgi:hypothetical protein
MTGNIERQLQATPNPDLVERVPQIVFDYLFRGSHRVRDLAIGKPLPNHGRDLYFLWR